MPSLREIESIADKDSSPPRFRTRTKRLALCQLPISITTRRSTDCRRRLRTSIFSLSRATHRLAYVQPQKSKAGSLRHKLHSSLQNQPEFNCQVKYTSTTMISTSEPTTAQAMTLFKDLEAKFPSKNLGEERWYLLAVNLPSFLVHQIPTYSPFAPSRSRSSTLISLYH